MHRKPLKTNMGKAPYTIQGNPRMLTADLSAETLKARREWQDILKVMKEKKIGRAHV